jgi:hypothetical protein
MTGCVAPLYIDVIDACGRWSLVGPLDELRERVFRSFRKDLDATVGAIFHPPRYPQPSRFVLCRRTKVNALYTSADQQMHLLLSHGSTVSSAHHVEAHAKVQFWGLGAKSAEGDLKPQMFKQGVSICPSAMNMPCNTAH